MQIRYDFFRDRVEYFLSCHEIIFISMRLHIFKRGSSLCWKDESGLVCTRKFKEIAGFKYPCSKSYRTNVYIHFHLKYKMGLYEYCAIFGNPELD